MPNPITYTCPQNAWTKVAIAVQSGTVTILDSIRSYRVTYRLTGEAPPNLTNDVLESAKVQHLQIKICHDVDIDVYIYTIEDNTTQDGKVVVYE